MVLLWQILMFLVLCAVAWYGESSRPIYGALERIRPKLRPIQQHNVTPHSMHYYYQ